MSTFVRSDACKPGQHRGLEGRWSQRALGLPPPSLAISSPLYLLPCSWDREYWASNSIGSSKSSAVPTIDLCRTVHWRVDRPTVLSCHFLPQRGTVGRRRKSPAASTFLLLRSIYFTRVVFLSLRQVPCLSSSPANLRNLLQQNAAITSSENAASTCYLGDFTNYRRSGAGKRLTKL